MLRLTSPAAGSICGVLLKLSFIACSITPITERRSSREQTLAEGLDNNAKIPS